MEPQTDTSVEAANPRAVGRRRVLSGVALVLACLTILLATVAVWVHQVAFNTDRFTGLVANVIDEPDVIAPLSAAVSEQVVAALDVQTRIAGRLPDVAKSLAPAITLAIQDGIASRLQVGLARPQVQALLLKTVSIAHTRVMNLLRGNSDAVSVVDGYVTIEVLPLVQAALSELQSVGLLPDGVQIPDLSTSEAPGVLVQRLSTALGVTLPADFGTIRLMPADRLLAAQTAVRAFDIIVVLLIVLSFVLVALAIWLARDRRRMVVYLALGTLIAFLVGRLAIDAFTDALISGIQDQGLAMGVRTVVEATVDNLRSVTIIIVIATAIVAVVAYLWGRPRWVVALTSGKEDPAVTFRRVTFRPRPRRSSCRSCRRRPGCGCPRHCCHTTSRRRRGRSPATASRVPRCRPGRPART